MFFYTRPIRVSRKFPEKSHKKNKLCSMKETLYFPVLFGLRNLFSLLLSFLMTTPGHVLPTFRGTVNES